MGRRMRPIPGKEARIYVKEEELEDRYKFLHKVAREALASLGLTEEDALVALPIPDSTWTEEDRWEVYGRLREVVGEKEARFALEELPKELPPSPQGIWVAIYVKREPSGGKWYAFEVTSGGSIKA